MIIRRAILEDAKGIAEVHVKSWQETYKGIVDQEYLDNLKVEDRFRMWEAGLSVKNHSEPVYVAENRQGEIIGFASFGAERSKRFAADGELYAIYLLEKYKGSKIGTALFAAGVKDFLSHYSSILVWVLAENKSRLFYEKFVPEKAGEEEITIAGKKHKEIAYVWKDIEDLNSKLVKNIK